VANWASFAESLPMTRFTRRLNCWRSHGLAREMKMSTVKIVSKWIILKLDRRLLALRILVSQAQEVVSRYHAGDSGAEQAFGQVTTPLLFTRFGIPFAQTLQRTLTCDLIQFGQHV